jgi:hypothetical protein
MTVLRKITEKLFYPEVYAGVGVVLSAVSFSGFSFCLSFSPDGALMVAGGH